MPAISVESESVDGATSYAGLLLSVPRRINMFQSTIASLYNKGADVVDLLHCSTSYWQYFHEPRSGEYNVSSRMSILPVFVRLFSNDCHQHCARCVDGNTSYRTSLTVQRQIVFIVKYNNNKNNNTVYIMR